MATITLADIEADTLTMVFFKIPEELVRSYGAVYPLRIITPTRRFGLRFSGFYRISDFGIRIYPNIPSLPPTDCLLMVNASSAGELLPPLISTMPTEMFKASRWTRGNFLFPTYIEVSEQAVTRHKRSWFSRDEISVSMSKVASVHIKTGILWSDILIESSGGSDPLASHGHTKSDAKRIKELVEGYQAAYVRNPNAQ